MTAADYIKREILLLATDQAPDLYPERPLDTPAQIRAAWDEREDTGACDHIHDIESEFREGQEETDIDCDYSRHYESRSVARRMRDGTGDTELREVPDFPGYYARSDGTIWSALTWHQERDECGRWIRSTSDELTPLKLYLRPGFPYYVVTLTRDGSQHLRAVHRIVMEAFIGARPPGMVCRHLNSNPLDNSVGNLAWGTQAENVADTAAAGRRPLGEDAPQSKLTVASIMEAMRLREDGWSWYRLAKRYGVAKSTIKEAATGVTWKHLHAKFSQEDK